jgi:hypothetical protein
MPEFFTQLLDYTMLFYVTGCILFWYRDAHHDEWPPFYPDFLILLLCIGLLIIRFLGCHLLNPKWCVSRRRFQSYDEILEEETKDYNSENPAKFINGEKSWYKYLLKDENDPDRIRWLNK